MSYAIWLIVLPQVNPQTVGMLYSKMKQSETATQCDQNMLRALADAKAEYRAESKLRLANRSVALAQRS